MKSIVHETSRPSIENRAARGFEAAGLPGGRRALVNCAVIGVEEYFGRPYRGQGSPAPRGRSSYPSRVRQAPRQDPDGSRQFDDAPDLQHAMPPSDIRVIRPPTLDWSQSPDAHADRDNLCPGARLYVPGAEPAPRPSRNQPCARLRLPATALLRSKHHPPPSRRTGNSSASYDDAAESRQIRPTRRQAGAVCDARRAPGSNKVGMADSADQLSADARHRSSLGEAHRRALLAKKSLLPSVAPACCKACRLRRRCFAVPGNVAPLANSSPHCRNSFLPAVIVRIRSAASPAPDVASSAELQRNLGLTPHQTSCVTSSSRSIRWDRADAHTLTMVLIPGPTSTQAYLRAHHRMRKKNMSTRRMSVSRETRVLSRSRKEASDAGFAAAFTLWKDSSFVLPPDRSVEASSGAERADGPSRFHLQCSGTSPRPSDAEGFPNIGDWVLGEGGFLGGRDDGPAGFPSAVVSALLIYQRVDLCRPEVEEGGDSGHATRIGGEPNIEADGIGHSGKTCFPNECAKGQ